MSNKLMYHFVQCKTTKNVWDVVRKRYLNVYDSLQVYKLVKKSFQLYQGGRSFSEYYSYGIKLPHT